MRLMRSGYEAFNRGDFDATTELMHPDIEFKRSDIAPEKGDLRGLEAIRAWMEPDVFEEQNAEVVEVVENGDKLFAECLFRVKVRGSAMMIENRGFHVWTIEGGKATRLEFYADRAPAREAAGLAS